MKELNKTRHQFVFANYENEYENAQNEGITLKIY